MADNNNGLQDFGQKIGDILGLVNRSVVRQGQNAGSISITGLLGNIANEPQRQKEQKLIEDLQQAKLQKVQQDLKIGRVDEVTAANQLATFSQATQALQQEPGNPDLVGALSATGRSDVAENAIVQQQNLAAKIAEANAKQQQRIELSGIKADQTRESIRLRGQLARKKVKLEKRLTGRGKKAATDQDIRLAKAKTGINAVKPPTLSEIQDARRTVGKNLSLTKNRGFDDKGNPLVNRADLPLIQATGDLAAGLMRKGVPSELAIAAAEDSISATTGGPRFQFPSRENASDGFLSTALKTAKGIIMNQLPTGVVNGLTDEEQGVLASVFRSVKTHVDMSGNAITKDMALPLETSEDLSSFVDMLLGGLQEAGFDVSIGEKGLEGKGVSTEFLDGLKIAISNAFPDRIAEPVAAQQ